MQTSSSVNFTHHLSATKQAFIMTAHHYNTNALHLNIVLERTLLGELFYFLVLNKLFCLTTQETYRDNLQDETTDANLIRLMCGFRNAVGVREFSVYVVSPAFCALEGTGGTQTDADLKANLPLV